MISQLTNHHSTTAVCAALGVNHSNYQYYLNHTQDMHQQKNLEDNLIRDEIEKLINKTASSRYGYRVILLTSNYQQDLFT